MVYVVQETTHNLQKAMKFGPMKVLFPQDFQFRLDAETGIARAKDRMRTFGPNDFLLLTGCPVAIGIATSLASRLNGGKYKVLKWERRSDTYWPVEIDLGEEKH